MKFQKLLSKCSFIYLLSIFFFLPLACNQIKTDIDLIIISSDKPLQLYALLESVDFFLSGICSIQVVYQATNQEYFNAYEIVKEKFGLPTYRLCRKDIDEFEFKRQVVLALHSARSQYILFSLDTLLVQDYVDLKVCVDALEQTQSYGFYLRLGKNLKVCGDLNCPQMYPPFKMIGNEINQWSFNEAAFDWGYPNTLEMALFRKVDIIKPFHCFNYGSIDELKLCFHYHSEFALHKKALCFDHSKGFSVVRWLSDSQNREFRSRVYEHDNLLKLFMAGNKIDIGYFYHLNNDAAQIEQPLRLISR